MFGGASFDRGSDVAAVAEEPEVGGVVVGGVGVHVVNFEPLVFASAG